ncbi:MAG: hypothetical protein ACJAWP_000454 [Porticoccus sp.]|jgi:hypothetical protein
MAVSSSSEISLNILGSFARDSVIIFSTPSIQITKKYNNQRQRINRCFGR